MPLRTPIFIVWEDVYKRQVFNSQSSSEAPCAKGMMPASMARTVGADRIHGKRSALLAEFRKGIKFSQQPDDGFSRAIGGGKTGFHISEFFLNVEPFFFKNFTQQSSRLILLLSLIHI